MKNKFLKSKYAIWLFPIFIAIAIFCFSAQPGDDSSQMSNGVIQTLLNLLEKTGIFQDMNREELLAVLSLPIRKGAHVTEYLLFCISLLVSFYISGFRKSASETPDGMVGSPRGHTSEMPDGMVGRSREHKWIGFSLLVTFLYACTDEFHQLFVPGRAGRFTDVLIDCTGALALCIILICIQRHRKNKLFSDKYNKNI